MERISREEYAQAYAEGYAAAMDKVARRDAQEKAYITKEDIIQRYGGKIGLNKAYEILQAVRHCCNGGKLNSSSYVLKSELEYWESTVDATYKARL